MQLPRPFLMSLALAAASVWSSAASAGSADADVVDFTGGGTLDARPEEVVAALVDQRTAAGWMPMVEDRHDLVVFSPTHRIEVTHLAMPWPATDRYVVDEGWVDRLPDGGYRLRIASVPRLAPAWRQPDKVLGRFLPSEFRVTPLAGGRASRLTFALHTDAGGSLPVWLVRLGQRNWPSEFLRGLRGELARRRRVERTAALP